MNEFMERELEFRLLAKSFENIKIIDIDIDILGELISIFDNDPKNEQVHDAAVTYLIKNKINVLMIPAISSIPYKCREKNNKYQNVTTIEWMEKLTKCEVKLKTNSIIFYPSMCKINNFIQKDIYLQVLQEWTHQNYFFSTNDILPTVSDIQLLSFENNNEFNCEGDNATCKEKESDYQLIICSRCSRCYHYNSPACHVLSNKQKTEALKCSRDKTMPWHCETW
jgi:hypothetical protein